MTNSSTPSFKGQDVYCGFDVHKTTWSLTVRLAGIDAFRTTLPADPEIAISTIRHRFPDATVHTVYEAGFSGFHIHRKFVAAGFDSIVVNPADIPTRDKERVFKNDQIDSAKLAKQLEAGMLEGKNAFTPAWADKLTMCMALPDPKAVRPSSPCRPRHARESTRLSPRWT